MTYAEPKSDQRGGGSRGGGRYSSRPQDPPFDFEDMRQLMYNNSRGVPNNYNPYMPSAKSPRGMTNPAVDSRQFGDASNMQQYNAADARTMQYAFWSNNK